MKTKLCALLLCLGALLNGEEEITPFFNYPPDEVKQLHQLQTQSTLDGSELRKWDAIATRAIEEKNMNFFDYSRLFTYLYVAQFEAATLSRNLTGDSKGSLDPISYQVLSLFLPAIKKPTLFVEDDFSNKLADLVLPHIKERINQENHQKNSVSVPKESQKTFSAGWEVGKWIPWFANPSSDYWPPAPPPANSPTWKEQIALIKEAQTPMTEQKREIIYRWAGLSYPWSSDIRAITNEYMDCHKTSLAKKIAVRAALMVSQYDGIAAYITSKYHYLWMRPQTYDNSVQYVIPVPLHPSYPAGHATESTIASKILSVFFPADASFWNEMGNQCMTSRIWAGIHYPIDNEAGKTCGTKVANRVLEGLFRQPE